MCCRKLGEKNMNMQAMLKQAQKLQKDMMNAKNEIDKMEFSNETSFVKVVAGGDKKIKSIQINKDSLDQDDIEMLEDIILVSVNDVLKQIEKVTEDKLGKYTKGMPGIF
jgi:DNA-binding YbaB/EbfC family protein